MLTIIIIGATMIYIVFTKIGIVCYKVRKYRYSEVQRCNSICKNKGNNIAVVPKLVLCITLLYPSLVSSDGKVCLLYASPISSDSGRRIPP